MHFHFPVVGFLQGLNILEKLKAADVKISISFHRFSTIEKLVSLFKNMESNRTDIGIKAILDIGEDQTDALLTKMVSLPLLHKSVGQETWQLMFTIAL